MASSAQRDPYAVLGVARTATQDEIKNAYRSLAKKHHPDLNPGSKEAEARFKEIGRAYELLGTPESRAKFDRGEFDEPAAGAAAGGFGGGRPFYRDTQADGGRYTYSFGEGFDEDLFADLFGGRSGGRGGGPRPRKGRDELYRMEVELRDAALGGEREITLPNGKRLRVRIPPGVDTGARLRFAGQGGAGANGMPPGDAYVEIEVRPDERFRREGTDLVLELPVSVVDAVLGGELRVPTLEGAVLLRVPPRSDAGTRLRMAGKGLVDRATGRRGNLLVELRLRLPAAVDEGFERALREYRERHGGQGSPEAKERSA